MNLFKHRIGLLFLLVIAGFMRPCFGAEENLWKEFKLPLPKEAADVTLHGITFLDDKQGWIVGDKGLCLTTADGGKTWTVQNTDTDASLRCVRFNDAQNGFIGGDGDSKAPKATGHTVGGRPANAGTILSTNDGGKTWKKDWIPNNFEIWCLETSTAPAIQAGMGLDSHLDGDILRSDDAGTNWNARRVFRALCGIGAVDKNHWIAVGSPVSVGFTGGEIKDPAYLATNCRAFFSADGGKNWTPSKGSDGPSCLRGLLIKNGLVLAAGDKGALLSSEDQGLNWKSLTSSTNANLRSVTCSTDLNTVVAVGDAGKFVISKDKAQSWQLSWVGQLTQLRSVATCGETLWAVGEKGAVYCAQVPALFAAKQLPTPPADVVKAAAIPTAYQLSKVKVGDFVVYNNHLKAEAFKMDNEWKTKTTVLSIADNRMTIKEETTGNPPQGQKVGSAEHPQDIAVLPEDFSTKEIGKVFKEEKQGPVIVKDKRIADEVLELNNVKYDCIVIESQAEVPGQMQGSRKVWYAKKADGVPLDGSIKKETIQSQTLPNGAKAEMVVTETLVEWGHASEAKGK